MATAVTVTFGANSTQFQAELAKMQTMAQASMARMNSGGFGGHGPVGMTGIIRESTVIGREIAMGRGLGRILASMTLLVQYLGSYVNAAGKASSYSRELADGYERQAFQANVAAIAAARKAEASAADAFAEGLEDKATIAAADADAVKADTAKATAVAAQEKASAAIAAAEAEEMEAAATGEATAASTPLLLIFLPIVLALAALYGGYKIVTAIIKRHNESQEDAQKTARSLSLSYNEEVEALDKLAKAAEKTDDALAKLNERHNDYSKRAEAYLTSLKNQAKAQEELSNAQNRGRMLDIELAEKSGKITKSQAIQQKADLEMKDVAAKAAAKTAALLDQVYASSDMQASASKAAARDAAAAKAASDAVNRAPGGIANTERLAQLEKVEKESQKKLDKINEEADNSVGSERAGLLGEAGTQQAIASYAHAQVEAQKSKMRPDELAAAEALRVASESAAAAREIGEKHSSAVAEWADQKMNSPAQVAAEQANIVKQARIELLGSNQASGGYGLNAQQRVGAYAATPPVFQQQLDALRVIAHNTAPGHPQTNQPPGARPPAYGARHKFMPVWTP